jgi:6-pyruvoyltetrahydropterin/6-carboxytetrahydropterin synthase
MPQDSLNESEHESILTDRGERTLDVGRDRPIRISSGHRILHHNGKCSRPHGHNYEIQVSLTGELTEEGWIADKGDITSIISEWDHMFLLQDGDPLIEAFEASGDGDAVLVLDYPPTAEVMSAVLEEQLLEELGNNVTDVTVEVSETGQLCASRSL